MAIKALIVWFLVNGISTWAHAQVASPFDPLSCQGDSIKKEEIKARWKSQDFIRDDSQLADPGHINQLSYFTRTRKCLANLCTEWSEGSPAYSFGWIQFSNQVPAPYFEPRLKILTLRSGGSYNDAICDGLATDSEFTCQIQLPMSASYYELSGKMTDSCIQLIGVPQGYSKDDTRHEVEIGILLINIR